MQCESLRNKTKNIAILLYKSHWCNNLWLDNPEGGGIELKENFILT
jgi:hypothetical protein